MLRLKQALADCRIPNQALVKISGCSKALISRTLASGVLPPQDAEKFKAGVLELVGQDNGISGWLVSNGFQTEDLFDAIPDPGVAAVPINPALNELECALYELAGRAALTAVVPSVVPLKMSQTILKMAQATIHLRRKLAETVGHDSPFVVRAEAEAAAILKGEQI